MTAWMDAAMWGVYGWYGIEPGDRMARFWGRPISGPARFKRMVADYLLGQRRLDAFNVTADESRVFFRRLLDWAPSYAYGYPSLIREFVEHLSASGADGRRLGLKVLIATGEVLDEQTRNLLREFFGCPVVNEYGCSESGILAFECQSGRPHLVPVAAYPEVIQEGARDSEYREGPVLTTDLYGSVPPFVRYSLDDIGRLYPPDECACGRELPHLEVLTGRADSFIRTPSGTKIYDAVLAYSVPSGVVQFRVQQSACDLLEGQVVVADDRERGEVLSACKERWSRAVDAELRIQVTAVDSIAPDESGKRRYFIPLGEASNAT